MLVQSSLDAPDDLCLLRTAQFARRNHVGIVCTPILDADLAVFPDHVLESDRRPGGRMKERAAVIRSGPLRTRDEIFSPDFRTVSAAAGLHQSGNERLLLLNRNRFHVNYRCTMVRVMRTLVIR